MLSTFLRVTKQNRERESCNEIAQQQSDVVTVKKSFRVYNAENTRLTRHDRPGSFLVSKKRDSYVFRFNI